MDLETGLVICGMFASCAFLVWHLHERVTKLEKLVIESFEDQIKLNDIIDKEIAEVDLEVAKIKSFLVIDGGKNE